MTFLQRPGAIRAVAHITSGSAPHAASLPSVILSRSNVLSLMRVLGVDYGTVKVGLALSDELRMLASPLKVLPSNAELAEEIARVVRERDVDTIVMGMPYLDGAETPTTAKVRAFADKLRLVVNVPIVYWDESFSSRFARSRMLDAGVRKKRRTARGTTDMWAAALILQEYLDNRDEPVDPTSPGWTPEA